jgi:Zn-dependent protease with chaperone function
MQAAAHWFDRRALRRFSTIVGVIVVLFGSACAAAPAQPGPALRTPFDARVDALSDRALLTLPPQALIDPARQRAAHAVADLRQGVFFAWAGAQIWAFAWLWQSGRAAQLRDWLRRHIRSRWAYRAAFGAALGVLAPLAGLPFAFIAYRIGFNVGLTEEIIGNWLLDYARGVLADAAGAAVAVALVLELVDRTRLWYLAYLTILFAVSIEIVGVAPVVFTPLATHLVRLQIPAAAPIEMSNGSERSRTLDASTAGIGRFTRIIVSDVLISAASTSEITYVVDHEDAHVVYNDDLKMALIAITMFVFAVAVAVLISDRIVFRRDDDAVSRLALVAACLGAVALVMYPLFNAYARGVEYRADEDARRMLDSPVPAVRFLVRRADHDLIPLCNRRSSSWYFADDPALGSRIAAMRRSEDPCPHSPATR